MKGKKPATYFRVLFGLTLTLLQFDDISTFLGRPRFFVIGTSVIIIL